MTMSDHGAGVQTLIGRARWLRLLLIIGWVLTLPLLLAEYAISHGDLPLPDPDDPLLIGHQGYLALALGSIALALVTAVVFAMWIHRAAANVGDVAGFAYTPGWAVGWYFVPIANLFKPFQAMRQIWNASHGASGSQLDQGHRVLTLWWALWLAGNIVGNIALQLGLRAQDGAQLETASLLSIAGMLLDLLLFPVAIRMVEAVTDAQRVRSNIVETFA